MLLGVLQRLPHHGLVFANRLVFANKQFAYWLAAAGGSDAGGIFP
jgi:hypothetical protein